MTSAWTFIDEPMDREAIYRQAYTHGAEAVITAVEPFLAVHKVVRIRNWATRELRNWRFHIDTKQRIEPPPLDLTK